MRAALVSLALAVAASGSAQSVLLRYHPPVGKTVSYTMSMSMSMTSPMGGSGGAIKFTQISPMKVRVLSRAGDATTVETRSGPAKMDAPAGSPMAGMARNPALQKQTVVQMTIDEFGTPRGAKGGGPAASIVGGMGAAMGQGSQGVAFPKTPVKVGSTWTSSIDFGKLMGSAPGGMKMNGKIPIVYRLTGLSGGVATIAMTAKGTMAMSVGARPMQMMMDLRSTLLIDTATGLTRSMSSTTDTTTTLPGMGAMHQHMTSTLK